ncbi:hypothetical protein B0H14DRAFT_3450996 [Mycena olivaceomarginata]|nr:hypothetical protein B0H14DRAFT_3450996 [Mycena olivaceomarginata]
MPPSSLDPGENSALVDAQNYLHTLSRAHARAAGPWLSAPTLSASRFGHARVPPDLRACLPVHRYPRRLSTLSHPLRSSERGNGVIRLPLMVIIFALRFLRDDPTTTPTRHDSLDLQPDINGYVPEFFLALSVSCFVPLSARPLSQCLSTSTTSHVLSLLHRRHPVTIQVNLFATSVPNSIIHHASLSSPSERTLPARMTMDLICRLQFDVAPQMLKFDTASQEFDVTLADEAPQGLQDQVDPRRLHRFIESKGSHNNTVLTAITALNVVICMQPKLSYPFNVRPFFTDRETKDIGPDLDLCKNPAERAVTTPTVSPIANGFKHATPRVLKKLSTAPANKLTFTMCEGQSMTVADYFQCTQNKSLQFLPNVICAGVGSGAFRWNCMTCPRGNSCASRSPPEKTKDVLDLAIKKPLDRLQGIKNGLGVLAYGQSEYVRQSW